MTLDPRLRSIRLLCNPAPPSRPSDTVHRRGIAQNPHSFRRKPDADTDPRRTGIPMIPAGVVVDVAYGSVDRLGVKHERFGGSFAQGFSFQQQAVSVVN